MPGAQREPGWVRAVGSLYSKGMGSDASSLPLAGPHERSILELFELTSVWAETAHFQLPTPRGYWRGLISSSERSPDLPLRERRDPLWLALECLGLQEHTCGWAKHPPLLAGFQGPD